MVSGLLNQLGLRYRTDKASSGHNYLDFYQRFLAEFREREIRLLEIGVGDGASLRMWRDFFPLAQIIGFDNNDGTLKYAGERITVVLGDQGNVDDLSRLANRYAPFDVIVDDGGHAPVQQITSLRTLFSSVAVPGYYILEDVGAQETVEYLQKICASVVQDGGEGEGDPAVTRYCQFAAVYNGTILIKR